MLEQADSVLYKLRFLIVAILIIGNLFLVSFFLSMVGATDTHKTTQSSVTSQSTSARATTGYDSPNVVAGGMTKMVDQLGTAIGSAGRTADDILQSATKTTAQGGRLLWRGGQFAVGIVGNGVTTMIRNTVNGVVFLVRIPVNVFGFISGTRVVRAAIQPTDYTPIPTIGPYTPNLLASTAAAPAQAINQPHIHQDSGAAWPIHGQVTTLFGVPHWPYQPTHTGIDISSGNRSGVTPIKPFKPGQIVEAARSYSGLGNYVTVDHGSGVTSVYAHLYSIAVQVGQAVDKNTVLGTEGSTGASTGTHLHFEVRINGQPVDPRQYVSSQP